MRYYCSKCKRTIPEKVYRYSKDIFNKILCRECQKGFTKTERISKSEKILAYELIKLGLRPEVQYKIDRITVDFAFLKEKIVIEIDGPHHRSRSRRETDGNRDDFLHSEGWRVRRFTAEETVEDPAKTAMKIKNFINRLEPPRKNKVSPAKKRGGSTAMIIIGLILIFLPVPTTTSIGIILLIIGIFLKIKKR